MILKGNIDDTIAKVGFDSSPLCDSASSGVWHLHLIILLSRSSLSKRLSPSLDALASLGLLLVSEPVTFSEKSPNSFNWSFPLQFCTFLLHKFAYFASNFSPLSWSSAASLLLEFAPASTTSPLTRLEENYLLIIAQDNWNQLISYYNTAQENMTQKIPLKV